jgi:hypothetical protein
MIYQLIVWYSVGFISTFVLLYAVSIDTKVPMTYSDLVRVFLWGFGGFFTLGCIVIFFAVWAIVAISTLKTWSSSFWQTPLFKKDR